MNRLTFLNIYDRLIRSVTNQRLNLQPAQLVTQTKRQWSDQNEVVTENQIRIALEETFQSRDSVIQVEDISGGCGTMFNIYVESSDFKGLSIPKQHQLVYSTLKKQIKNIHGLHLETKVPT